MIYLWRTIRIGSQIWNKNSGRVVALVSQMILGVEMLENVLIISHFDTKFRSGERLTGTSLAVCHECFPALQLKLRIKIKNSQNL